MNAVGLFIVSSLNFGKAVHFVWSCTSFDNNGNEISVLISFNDDENLTFRRQGRMGGDFGKADTRLAVHVLATDG